MTDSSSHLWVFYSSSSGTWISFCFFFPQHLNSAALNSNQNWQSHSKQHSAATCLINEASQLNTAGKNWLAKAAFKTQHLAGCYFDVLYWIHHSSTMLWETHQGSEWPTSDVRNGRTTVQLPLQTTLAGKHWYWSLSPSWRSYSPCFTKSWKQIRNLKRHIISTASLTISLVNFVQLQTSTFLVSSGLRE